MPFTMRPQARLTTEAVLKVTFTPSPLKFRLSQHLLLAAEPSVQETSTSFERTYQEGADFLRGLGLDNRAEVARILDIAMNPGSLFISFRDRKRSGNPAVRTSSISCVSYDSSYQLWVLFDMPVTFLWLWCPTFCLQVCSKVPKC